LGVCKGGRGNRHLITKTIRRTGSFAWNFDMGYDTIIGKVFLFCTLPVLVVGGVTILYFS